MNDRALLVKIGEGGMGQVFRAVRVAGGRRVARKAHPPARADDAGSLERFRREVKPMRSFSRPHVVPVLEHGILVVRPFGTMERIGGPRSVLYSRRRGCSTRVE